MKRIAKVFVISTAIAILFSACLKQEITGIIAEDFTVNRESLRRIGENWESDYERSRIGSQPEQSVLSMEEMELDADAIISHFFDLSGYTRRHFYREDTRIHRFQYVCYETEEFGASRGNVQIANSGHIMRVELS